MDWTHDFFNGPFFARDYAAVELDTNRTELEVTFLVCQLDLGSDSSVLDLACGSGRHALAIAPLVKEIVGHDISTGFIEAAKKNAVDLGLSNASFAVSDMRGLDFDSQFDAAYNYFTAWGYYDFETNMDVLKHVRRALKPGARFLLEILNRDNITGRFQPKDHKRLADGTVVLYQRRFDCGTGRMFTGYTHIKDGIEKTSSIDHYIPSPDALVRHFQSAGFTNVQLLSAPDGGEVTLQSRRIAVIGEA